MLFVSRVGKEQRPYAELHVSMGVPVKRGRSPCECRRCVQKLPAGACTGIREHEAWDAMHLDKARAAPGLLELLQAPPAWPDAGMGEAACTTQSRAQRGVRAQRAAHPVGAQ